MKYNKLYSVDEISKLIRDGKSFFIAGDEKALSKLPKGQWIGGSIPYFMADTGGLISQEKVFATEVPDFAKGMQIKSYNLQNISQIYLEAPSNGFSLIVIPAFTDIHMNFATKAPEFPDFASRPLIGWIAGVHLNELQSVKPKVYNGKTNQSTTQEAIVMHVTLDDKFAAEIGIVNIFEPGDGDTIEFLETGFSAKEIRINGEIKNFVDYCQKTQYDVRLPLVADYAGAMINVSIQNIDTALQKVDFYAPVFKGVKYKKAKAVKDYIHSFSGILPQNTEDVLFSCNCILNFLYSELEGKATPGITGPITFGEVAYQLLNQTMVYLDIHKLK